MKITPVNSMTGPAAVGGYSQAALVEGANKLLFVSGQIPESVNGAVPDNFESQCRLVWSNLVAQLKTAEMAITNLTKVTIFLSSRQYADINSKVRQEILGEHKPALTIIIAGIFNEKWLLEIEAVAAA
jgi:2-iminobutanoate/2-iminopropanoate deaminase